MNNLAFAVTLGVVTFAHSNVGSVTVTREMPSNCPSPAVDDVIYEVRIRYYDADVFTPTGYNFVNYGPALGSLTAPDRIVGALNPTKQETRVKVEEIANGSITFSLSNTAEVLAQRPDGHSFGNGGRIIVDAYVRGSAGTPYYATRMAQGQVEANFPQGFGRADAEFNGQIASSVNGAGVTTLPVQLATISTGITSIERDFGGVIYSHAGQYGYDVNGTIFQSLDFCLPFTGCPTMHYWARAEVTGSMCVGIGSPPCSGTLEQDWCTDCLGGLAAVKRRFAVTAEFVPFGAQGTCDCCEYRQYVRRASTDVHVSWLNYQFDAAAPYPPNAKGERKDCDNWAEDSGPSGGQQMIGYGHRPPFLPGDFSLGVYTNTPQSLQQTCNGLPAPSAAGCYYASRDFPGMSGIIGGFKHYVEFEGRIVSKASCTPGATHDVVLVRKRWTMCCETSALGIVSECGQAVPPQLPPSSFTSYKSVGQRNACVLFTKDGQHMLAYAVVEVNPQSPLGVGAVTIDIPGVTTTENSEGPFQVDLHDGQTSYIYFPFLLSSPVGGAVTVTVDVLGQQATWQVDLTELGGPQTYCTSGTTSHGCLPIIYGSGTPSASGASAFSIGVTSVEGQKVGLVFYGLDNSGFVPSPWGGSTSYLCVRQPTQRSGSLNSGGTPNACDGTLWLNWSAYIAAHPNALGNPFASGQHVFAQAWFRDPPSPKTTNLSNGLEFVLQP